jgi:hypothetical protein
LTAGLYFRNLFSTQEKEVAMRAKKKYPVRLTAAERATLKAFVSSGEKKARQITRARILLLADAAHTDTEIMTALGCCRPTVIAMRKRYASGDFEDLVDLLQDAPREGRPIRIDSRVEAQISMIACSDPPPGAARWTLQLIADRLVKLEMVESISHERVRQALKKTA